MKNNKKITTKLFIATMLFLSSFTVFAQETVKEFETITDAINYSGDKSAVKKLVVEGEISGYDYSDESEWSMFRFLDEVFPNIEEVELLTFQDLLDADEFYKRSLFYWNYYEGALWLKKFSAPNTQYIGSYNFAVCENLEEIFLPEVVETALMSFGYCNSLKYVELPNAIHIEDFYNCEGLISVYAPKAKTLGSMCFYRCYSLLKADFPECTTIGSWAFSICSSMVSVNFPKATKILGFGSFSNCYSLTSFSIGTELETETEIELGHATFASTPTENVILKLSQYVIPKPDTVAKIWGNSNCEHPYYGNGEHFIDYVWKNIIIYTDIVEELEDEINISYLGNNIYFVNSYDILEIELYDIMGRLIRIYENKNIINLDDILKGCYLFRIKTTTNKNYTVIKIINN